MADQSPAVGSGTVIRMPSGNAGKGRPTRADEPNLLRVIETAILAGMKPVHAARHAGLYSGTHRVYMRRGQAEAERLEANPRAKPRDRETPYLDYYELVGRAEADALANALAHITNAMPTNWTAAAWWAERTYPEEYSRPEVRAQFGPRSPVGLPVAEDVDVRDELAASFAQMHQRLRSAGALPPPPTTQEPPP